MISLATADISPKMYLNIFDCLNTTRIGRGKYVSLLEERAAEYFGVKHCIAVANGTIADIIMLAALKEMHPGKDEVILPAHTFIAQANAVRWAGLKPVFVDTFKDYAPSTESVLEKITPKTLCYFPVHLIGKQGYKNNDFPENLVIIEDCCEAMGGEFDDWRKFGTVSLGGSFSMYPSHTVTTGEGGLITTNDDLYADICRSIHNHGKSGSDFDFSYVGINGKITNLQAAIGCELVGLIDEVNRKRKKNVKLYNSITGGTFEASSPHCYPVIYNSKDVRDAALTRLAEHEIEARKLMGCIPDSKPYRAEYGEQIDNFPTAQMLSNCGLFVPVHQNMEEWEIERVCDVL